MKRFLLTGVIIALGSVGSAWGQVRYALTDLGVLAGNDANAINLSGQVVGGKNFGSEYHAFLYSGGVTQDLGTLSPSQSWSVASGINNLGQIVGSSANSAAGGISGQQRPIIVSGGTMASLGSLGGGYGFANGINNLGQVVGLSTLSDDETTHAFLYSGDSMTDLGSLTGNGGYSDAYAINDEGQVTGVSTNASGNVRGFLWQSGSMTDIGDLSGGTGDTYAYAINNSAQIAGETWPGGSQPHDAFLWQDGVMTSLGVGKAEGINDSGEVVGENSSGAFLWTSAGGLQNVGELLDSSGIGWMLEGAKGINDEGQIVGYGINPQGQTDGFLLTRVPEPSTVALLCVGAFGFAACILRRRAATAVFGPRDGFYEE